MSNKVTKPIATTLHKCGKCLAPIQIGFPYVNVKKLIGDKHITVKLHDRCYVPSRGE